MHSDLLDTILYGRKDANHPDGSAMKDAAASEEAKCPVDHKTRETWLRQARAMQQPNAPAPTTATTATTAAEATSPVPAANTPPAPQTPTAWSWSSWRVPFFSSSSPPTTTSPVDAPAAGSAAPSPAPAPASQLPTSRVVSTIPRTSNPGPTSCPANHEQETGVSETGNWVYPSQQQFFDALRRKGYDGAAARDMATVVPIHNAVNERAWAEILAWEAPYAAQARPCGGPRLHSFAGRSERMTPRARVNTLLGYTAPFDRHDWVVDRCGTRVEYVIDFYAGRPGGDGSGRGRLNFYLDVRPKLNTWEGVRMRALKGVGLA